MKITFCLFWILTMLAIPWKVFAQSSQQDSASFEPDCIETFFRSGTPVKHPANIKLVLKNKKTLSLKKFTNEINPDHIGGDNEISAFAVKSGLVDLDHDGKKELVINNFTGGAHCCDEFYFFRPSSPGNYLFVAKTFAGDVCPGTNSEFSYGFYQMFGYFFTCYACSIQEDSTVSGLKPAGVINLKYTKGRLVVVPGNEQDKARIMSNLAILKNQPFVKMEEAYDQDNGLRKEFALNLAEYYFLFNKHLMETKKLFDAYYRFPDAKKVWKAFQETLKEVKKANDF